jgi:hypothetical protein
MALACRYNAASLRHDQLHGATNSNDGDCASQSIEGVSTADQVNEWIRLADEVCHQGDGRNRFCVGAVCGQGGVLGGIESSS